MGSLTPNAKSLLSSTIRDLRLRLLRDLRGAAESDYRLSVRAQDAGLIEVQRLRRSRLEAWVDERVRAARPKNEASRRELWERMLDQAVKEAAATLLNRLVLVRHMEAVELSKPPVVTGGWNSKGYRELREFAPDLLGDETEGYGLLLQLLFDELALDLPGLFGDVGVTRLFRIPAGTLREVVERLDDPALASAWTDDTTLGWVYQYWNDPEREALDDKINAGGKIEPHEIASKTQMFTERYMVEWLLHNSLGLMWLAICRKHGWAPDAERVLDDLDRRRAEWRARRDAGEAALDALMPLHSELEERWKYYVPQPIPDDAVASAPESVRTLKLLDIACGSGHFLVIAFDLLVALYREEARHRGESWDDQEIAESILENNLFGVDIDPRAIQIAAAGLYLKAKLLHRQARIRSMNLVAPALNLAQLPEDDPSLKRLVREVREETGIPEELTRSIVSALAGVDHQGTLLRVDAAVDEAIRAFEKRSGATIGQGKLFEQNSVRISAQEARTTVLGSLERFLARHKGEDDLGLRLDGEQLAAGVRFVRIVKEGTYHVVVGNPPYQGARKMSDASYLGRGYPRAKANLYSAFLQRGLELAKPGQMSALLTMRGWMFQSQFTEIRTALLESSDLRVLTDVDRGGFEDILDEIVATAMSVFRKCTPSGEQSLALQPTPLDDSSRDSGRTTRKRASVLAQVGIHRFSVQALRAIAGEPIVYWWSQEELEEYAGTEKLGDGTKVRQGLATGNDTRYLRQPWEVDPALILAILPRNYVHSELPWSPYIKGAEGARWCEPLLDLIRWQHLGLEKRVAYEAFGTKAGNGSPSANLYFRRGVAFSMIGLVFAARAHRYPSVFGQKGSSVFPEDIPGTVCLMNSHRAQRVLQSLSGGMGYQVGDVTRLPVISIAAGDEIFMTLERSFSEHEAAREGSVEFRRPGSSNWRFAQSWAQRAVDRPEGEPVSPYEPECDPPEPEQFVSFAFGAALGRFGPHGEGILDGTKPDHAKLVKNALPHGVLFVSDGSTPDSLDHPACRVLLTNWEEHGRSVSPKEDLRSYLRSSFFAHHKRVYENRPIYFPLSSAKKSFVAWVSIHRWRADTLQTLMADYLLPEQRSLEGQLNDLRTARSEGRGGAGTEKRFEQVKRLVEELDQFVVQVAAVANQGPPPSEIKCAAREADARFEMDLDDGVMVNSAALWPLLEPQWKSPKTWWRELAEAKGKKDYDWSHLAARYFPTRVDGKCRLDPSLAVAHACFWKYHAAKAYRWELRLQDEIRPDFTIDEDDSDVCRTRFLEEHLDEAAEILEKELKRRERKRARESGGPLFEDQEDEGLQDADADGEEAVDG